MNTWIYFLPEEYTPLCKLAKNMFSFLENFFYLMNIHLCASWWKWSWIVPLTYTWALWVEWWGIVCTDMERGYVEVPHHSTPELLSVSYRYVKVWGNIHELSSRLETKLLQFLTKYSFQTSIANSYVQASVFSTDRLRNILNLPTRESLHMTVCYINENKNSYIEIFQHKLKAEEQYWWKFNQTKTSLPQTGF